MHAEISPGLVEAIIKHANMERRLVSLFWSCTMVSVPALIFVDLSDVSFFFFFFEGES